MVKFNLLNFNELKSMDLKPETSLIGSITDPSINMIYASTGFGKSLLAISIAVHLSIGKDLFDWEVPSTKKVLYIDGEMSLFEFRKRVLRFTKEEVLNDNLFLLSSSKVDFSINLYDSAQYNKLFDQIIENKFEVVFFDNLTCLTQSLNGNDNSIESFLAFRQFLIRLRNTGITSIFLHHANKSGGQRGSSVKKDAVNISLRLDRPDDYTSDQKARFVIYCDKNRNGVSFNPIDVTLIDLEDGSCEFEYKHLEDIDKKIQEMRNKGIKQVDIAKELNITQGTVSKKISSYR